MEDLEENKNEIIEENKNEIIKEIKKEDEENINNKDTSCFDRLFKLQKLIKEESSLSNLCK